MENPTFLKVVAALEPIYGPLHGWESGKGVRCTSVDMGKITVYHDAIAPGNLAEIAFDVDSMVRRSRATYRQAVELLNELALSTGRPVRTNSQYRWPRVGISKDAQIAPFATRLASFLGVRLP